MILFRFILLTLLLFSFNPAISSPSAEVSLNRTTLTIHDTLIVTLKLNYPQDFQPDNALLLQNLLRKDKKERPPFLLIDHEIIDRSTEADGTVIETQQYTLEPWQEGQHSISFRNIQFNPTTPEKKPISLYTNILSINIIPSEKKDLSDFSIQLLPPPGTSPLGINASTREKISESSGRENERNIELFNQRNFPWGTVITLLTVMLLLWVWRKPLLNLLTSNKNSYKIDPQTRALEQLKKLEGEGLPEKGLFEQYYVSLTTIVRSYIEDKFKINANEQTTEEFLEEVSSNPYFQSETGNKLETFLRYADLVKFARYNASPNDASDALHAARRFIQA